MERYIKNDKIKFKNQIVICKNDIQVINPPEEMMFADGWQKYILPQTESYIPSYEERVEQLIRERYTANQELAIQRQRETKPDEFEEYFTYCEECKAFAKNGLLEEIE